MATELPGPWRSLPWRLVLGATAVGAAAMLLSARWPETVLIPLGVWAGFASFVVAVAYLLDEPSAEVVRTTPRRAGRWQAQRLAIALLPLLVGLGALAVVHARAGSFSWAGTAIELVGLLIATVGASAAMLSRNPTPGSQVGEAAGLLVMAIGLTEPVGRWVDVLPFEDGARWERTLLLWGAVAVLAVAALARARREPLDRCAHRGHGRLGPQGPGER